MPSPDDFTRARFATHPDGRIAARVDSNDVAPWRTGGYPAWHSDEEMARDGWSPLDESRPGDVTDEMMDRAMLAARNCASTRWALWADVRTILAAAPTTDVDARTYALEQIEAAQAETTEAVKRAERAEQEREEAIREAEELGKALDNVKSMDAVTAREHMDAAWEAAYVSANGIIPAGTEYLSRDQDGAVSGPLVDGADLPSRAFYCERRLLNPPAVVVSYTKRLALELENAGWIREGGAEGVARHLDALGVRAPENTEKEADR